MSSKISFFISTDKIQTFYLETWIVELYLNSLLEKQFFQLTCFMMNIQV